MDITSKKRLIYTIGVIGACLEGKRSIVFTDKPKGFYNFLRATAERLNVWHEVEKSLEAGDVTVQPWGADLWKGVIMGTQKELFDEPPPDQATAAQVATSS